MKVFDRKKYSYKLYYISSSEISDSIMNGTDSAYFGFESERYSVEISLFPDDITLIQIWGMKNDNCPAKKWDDVRFSVIMREIHREQE